MNDDDDDFDAKLVASAFELAGETGWSRASVAEAARRAGLPLDRARGRFPGLGAVLQRFGRIADQAALAGADPASVESPRDRLFDMLMRRIDVLQAHRDGTLALLRAAPASPLHAAMLAAATLRSMGWMLEGAGIASTGLRGMLRAKGLLAVWLYAVHAWQSDELADLSATMSALDRALDRAEQVDGWAGGLGPKTRSEPEAEASASDSGDVPQTATSPHEVTLESLPHTSPPPPDVADAPPL